jgi:hypothetical protein
MGRRIKQAFNADRVQRVKVAGDAIESALKRKDLTEAWSRLKSWYRQASDRPPKPSRQDLESVTRERIDLYTARPPPGAPIPVLVEPFPIPDSSPTYEEISLAVKRLRRGKAPGPTGLRTDNIKTWLAEAKRETDPRPAKFIAFVRLIRHVYETGELPTQMTWSTVVLLPKSDGGVRGIGLLDVAWKVLASIIDHRISANVEYHDSLHGFRARRGTGTAVLEAKLFQQLATLHQVPIFEVFIDLKKAYDSVDRERLLDTLSSYGVGANMRRVLSGFWEQQVIVARQSGFYGTPFRATRGETQGDPASPTLFNVLVDSVVRYWLTLVQEDDGSEGVSAVIEQLTLFYADDGLIGARDSDWLQRALTCLVDLFERVGLQTNISKTKAMTCIPGSIRGKLSTLAYKRWMDGAGLTSRERQRQRVSCPTCGQGLAAGSLKQHMRTQHGTDGTDVEEYYGRADAPGRQPAGYSVSFPQDATKLACPVVGCWGTATSRSNLRRHFMHRHPEDSIRIREERGAPLPRCESCGLHAPYTALNRAHYDSALCRAGANRMRQRRAQADVRRALGVTTLVKGVALDRVNTFRYLGRPLSMTDEDWPAVYRNLTKARAKWGRLARVLTREGACPRTAGKFYKVVVQSVLLYGCETWVVTPAIRKVLEGFHNRVARRLSGCRGRYVPSTDTFHLRIRGFTHPCAKHWR